jgi:lysozyme
VQKFEGALKQCVTVSLAQYEYDAYVALSFNVGSRNFCTSTLVRKLNSGDYEGAGREILRWNRASGRVVDGLTVRREREYQQCIGAIND